MLRFGFEASHVAIDGFKRSHFVRSLTGNLGFMFLLDIKHINNSFFQIIMSYQLMKIVEGKPEHSSAGLEDLFLNYEGLPDDFSRKMLIKHERAFQVAAFQYKDPEKGWRTLVYDSDNSKLYEYRAVTFEVGKGLMTGDESKSIFDFLKPKKKRRLVFSKIVRENICNWHPCDASYANESYLFNGSPTELIDALNQAKTRINSNNI